MKLFHRLRDLSTLTLFAVLLFAWPIGLTGGCGGDPTAVVQSDDRETLASTIVEEYEIVATASDEDTSEWNLTLKRPGDLPPDELTFLWDIDGETYEGVSLSHTFPGPGTYNVNVTAVDRKGAVVFTLELEVEVPVLNDPPYAEAGEDQTVNENELVFLYGGTSSDPDNDELTYLWAQTGGPPVQLLYFTEPVCMI